MSPNRRGETKRFTGAWLPADLKAALAERATDEGLSLSDAITRAIEEWLRSRPA